MKRFKNNRRRLLIEALRQQRTLGCLEPAIEKIANVAKCKNYAPKSPLIIQGSDDNNIAFILTGRVHILVKGQKVAERASGQHVGEMSVIDPSARRSATVIASERTSVAWVKEKDFTKIANAHPQLWRSLAVEIADRLRQRGALLRDPNPVPEIFIGSSSESIKVAKAIERALKPDPVDLKLWTDGIFGASDATIESLEKRLARTDFAILILTADDTLRLKKKRYVAPRDNLIFELGLFMGAIGRKRTFMLVEKKTQTLRLPSDLRGVTYLSLATKSKKALEASVTEAVSEIRQRVSEVGPR